MENKKVKEILKTAKKYLSILKGDLSKTDDKDEQATFEGKILKLEETINQYNDDLNEESLSDLNGELMSQAEDYFSLLKSKGAKDTEKKEINTILNSIKAFSDIKTAKEQISSSEASINSLEEPSAPSRFKKSEELRGAIDRAVNKGSAVSLNARTAGLEREILDNYNRDLNSAKIASTGQAGAYGAYSQAASNRKLKGALAVQDAKLRLRDLDNKNLNYLISQDINQNKAYADSDLRVSDFNYRKYKDEAFEAGRALASGKKNLRTGVSEALDAIPSFYESYNRNREDKAIRGYRMNEEKNRISGLESVNSMNRLPSKTNKVDFENLDSLIDYENYLNRK